MPWQEVTTMTLRAEFVMLAVQDGSNISQLCRLFNISRDKGYKWIRRFKEHGDAGLYDCSRRPHNSPVQTDASVESAILALRKEHPAWGGRKIKACLEADGKQVFPAASTITEILRRNGQLDLAESAKHKAFIRFEHPSPNALWQMDFKGHFPTRQGRCHPLTVLDDHSRYNLVLQACYDETTASVKSALVAAFRNYGLPDRMTMDNGSPWGNDGEYQLTVLTAWLIRLGVGVSHSRPYHPQTQGKDERFHRTLLVEAIAGRNFDNLAQCQQVFDHFRVVYNSKRPHESLGQKPPVTRYQPSVRMYPEVPPRIEYAPGDHVRKVQDKGTVFFKGHVFQVSRALRGEPVAFRPTDQDGTFLIYYCHHKLREIRIGDKKVSPMSPNDCHP